MYVSNPNCFERCYRRLTMVFGFALANQFGLIKWDHISLFLFTVKVRCGVEVLNSLVSEEKISLEWLRFGMMWRVMWPRVLLSLLRQLACDIGNDTSKTLGWMMDVVVAFKPTDGIISMHIRPIFEQAYSIR
ncbi:hypothetical protein Hanom_Chr03g00264871 [Helianthus anomalus]